MPKKKASKKPAPKEIVAPPPRAKIIDRSYHQRASLLGGFKLRPEGGEILRPGDKVSRIVEGVVVSVEKWEGDKEPLVTLDLVRDEWRRV